MDKVKGKVTSEGHISVEVIKVTTSQVKTPLSCILKPFSKNFVMWPWPLDHRIKILLSHSSASLSYFRLKHLWVSCETIRLPRDSSNTIRIVIYLKYRTRATQSVHTLSSICQCARLKINWRLYHMHFNYKYHSLFSDCILLNSILKYHGIQCRNRIKYEKKNIFANDLWPLTLKINRVYPLILTNMCAKFDEDLQNCWVSIMVTSWKWQTHAHTYTHTEMQGQYHGSVTTCCAGILKALYQEMLVKHLCPLPQHIRMTFILLTWLSIGIIYSSRTIYLPS